MKDKLKKHKKNNLSQSSLTHQIHDSGRETKITSHKVNQKTTRVNLG
jgi:hypothetical protein